MQETPLTTLGVLAVGGMLVVALFRWVVNFMKGYEQRRLELLKMYEEQLIENARLRGQLQISEGKTSETQQRTKYYYREYQRYKNLYDNLDKRGKEE